jgi:hypothetical protein
MRHLDNGCELGIFRLRRCQYGQLCELLRLVLTTVDISNDVKSSTIKRNEAEGEKDPHAQPRLVRSAGVTRDHG